MILVSSEYAFPYELTADPKLDFSINSFILAGKIAAKDAYKLSGASRIASLAGTIIDHFGGHMWYLYLALIPLSMK